MLTVKANQPKLHDQLGSLPWKQVRAGHKTRETANGREIERTVKCVSIDAGIKFPHAAQITRKSRPTGTREWSTETVYIVISLTPALGKPELSLLLEMEGDCSLSSGDAGDDVLFTLIGSQAGVAVDGVAPEKGHPACATHPAFAG